MRNIIMWFFLPCLATCLAAQTNDVLHYEPAEVAVSGTIIRQVFPGPPNFEDVTNGDEAEACWVLHLKKPVDVADSQPPDIFDCARKDVRKMQLVFHVLNDKSYDDFRALLGKPVVVSGQLFGAHTGHHHTDVLLKVRDISLESHASSAPANAAGNLKPGVLATAKLENKNRYAWPKDSVPFPGADYNLSPDKQWRITCVIDPKNEASYLEISHQSGVSGVSGKKPLYNITRYSEILWSKDSAVVAITDWIASNCSDIYIIHPQNPARHQTLSRIVPDISKNLASEELGGHVYWQALEWEDNTTLRIRIFGHTDEKPLHEFLYEFRVSLAGRSCVLLHKENSEDCDAETQVWGNKTTSRIPVGN